VAAGASLHTLRLLSQKFLRGCCSPDQYCRSCSTEIHRCFERANQLLSLLVPVSDINRAAAGKVAVHRTVSFAKLSLAGTYIPNLPNPNRASGEV